MEHTCRPGSHTWRATVQHLGAIFKIYLPVEQISRVFLFADHRKSTPLSLRYLEKEHTTGGDYWRLQRIFKTNPPTTTTTKSKLVTIQASFSGKPRRAFFVSSIILKTSNSRGREGTNCFVSVQMSLPHTWESHRAGGHARTHWRGFWDVSEPVRTKANFSEALVRLAWAARPSASWV